MDNTTETSDKESYTIGRLARAAGVGIEAIRYYQRRSLLSTPAVDEGYRHYDRNHLERLRFIKRAQSVGFTLEEIAELLSLNDTRDHRLARRIAQEKLHDVESRIEQLEKVAQALRTLVSACECGGQEMPCPIIRMTLDP